MLASDNGGPPRVGHQDSTGRPNFRSRVCLKEGPDEGQDVYDRAGSLAYGPRGSASRDGAPANPDALSVMPFMMFRVINCPATAREVGLKYPLKRPRQASAIAGPV